MARPLTAKSSPKQSIAAPWYRRKYSRLLVDMHIPDEDPRYLQELDPRMYVETVARGGSGAIMLYCNSHVGPALYPSKLGPVHRALGKGDFVGDVLRHARRKKLAVVAYYSVVFNNAAFREHPDWHVVPARGESLYETSRYGTCCPNSPYRQFAVDQTAELCARYDFDGIFFDMLFWPYPCYCPHCRERFAREQNGAAIPEVVDWNNPLWVAFQRARERWMSGFAGELTATVRRTRSAMSCTHQLSPVLHDWRVGMPYALTEHCDYACGDFYGPPVQQSVVCKIFAAISRNQPFEFMTSRCTDLRDHVTTKKPWQMEMQALLAPAHGAAFMFIDAIDPVGTLNRGVYERIGTIFGKLRPYEKFLGGQLMADVAIYVSSESRFDFHENGRKIKEASERADNMVTEFAGPHMASVMGAAQSLQEAHIPYAVVTRLNLAGLKRYRAVIAPNVLLLSDEEVEALREYVRDGGALYASGYTSLVGESGKPRADFALADLFGVSAKGKWDDSLAFFQPEAAWLKPVIAPQPQFIHRSGWLPVVNRSATVLASRFAPWFPEHGGSVLRHSFASIHSTPPALDPSGPALVWNRFGKGRVVYAAGPIEMEKQVVSRGVFAAVMRRLLGAPTRVEAEAPDYVEITALEKADERKINISLVSLRQNDEPVPCAGTVRVRLEQSRRVKAVRLLPGRRSVPARRIPGGIEFPFRDFETFALFELEYTTNL